MKYLTTRKYAKQSVPPIPDRHLVTQDLTVNLADNLANLNELLESCYDIVIKEFKIATNPSINASILFFDGLVDRVTIEFNVLKPLMFGLEEVSLKDLSSYESKNVFNIIKERILSVSELETVHNLQDVIHHISSGDTIILIDGYATALVAGTRTWQSRNIDTPENEIVIFGPKEGFTETLLFNTAALRRRIKSTSFKMEAFVMGRITKTDVVLCYIENIAPYGLVNEIKSRLDKIDIDGILDTGYLKELITDERKSVFTQIEHTEKPDRVCAHLLEGRICILVDGSPMAMVMPITFPQYLIASEDYYTHYIPASFFRLLRFFALFIALLLPSLYVAVITFHHEMIPTSLYLTIAATRQGVPFPPFIEALLLEVTFEMLREAGLRLPRAVGPAVSIVGALIIGDAAVRAGLVSTPIVVVVAFTGIASFVTPAYNAGIVVRLSRFAFLFSAAILGFLGIMITFIIFITRMVSISSFGQPYLSPIAPLNLAQLSDIIIRRPWFMNVKRPYMDGMENQRRAKMPHENRGDGE
ncbi:MAG: spore germination protein [Syntrophomonadaceae bacterium]|nr:spore germination protein [Syntrophomonadaceae bacterium]